MRPRLLVPPLPLVLAVAAADLTAQDGADDLRFYRDEVQPVLEANCYRCHGDRSVKIRGDLWLRTRTNVLRGGHSGPIVDLVEPEQSRILRFINHEDREHRMPPKEKLANADIAALTEWVHRGVPMPVVDGEWIYDKPDLITDEARAFWSFQPVAAVELPAVRDPAWCRSEIDRFVLARLEQAGLRPVSEADRVSLIRRATYDLIGLPPTPAEVDAFVADEAPDAWARLVDRLLASPHYGERQGRHWLDLVRYAETNGYERDSDKPEVWRYRQYVIDALNADVPYDRFVLEQLAGDELEDADADSITATGYYRLGLWDDEPADAEQAVLDGLDDVVRTTGEVFFGLTMGCARCHDHKLDPIPQADYYRMLAFFHNVEPYANDPRRILTDVATAAEKAQVAAQNAEIRAQRTASTQRLHDLRARFAARHREETGAELASSDLSELRYAFYRDTWKALPDFGMLKAEATGRVESDLFDIGLATRDTAFGFVFEGKLWVPEDGEYAFALDSDDGARLTVNGAVVVEYDGVHGLGEPRHGKAQLTRGHHAIRLEYFQGQHGRGLHVTWSGADFDERRLSAADGGKAKRRLDRAIARDGERLLGAEEWAEYQRLERELKVLRDIPEERYVLSVRERGTEPPPTHVMIRGSAHAPGDEVEPGFPQILTSAEPAVQPRAVSSGRRLAFARWLVDPDHPLTARVIVNRVWQFHFGRGLVRSPNNFGMQGQSPTHPLLLDWLARTFVEDGWSLKKLHRRIMLSATYRLSSRADQRALGEDPANDLLWRFDMRRLSAEEIRDSILAITGVLDATVGGPSVYPEFPAEVLAGQSRVTWRGNDAPANNHRRTIYTSVKRSLLDPFVESFDAATTDASCPVRFQTTQPAQALTMLNSELVNEAAARLAERLRREAGPDPRDQVARALRLATGRRPTEDDVARGVEFLQSFPDPAGPDQALQQLCLIVLSLNEFLFVD